MKNLQFFENLTGNISIFSKFFKKFYRIFLENLGKNLENFRNMYLYVFGGGAPWR